MLCLTLSPYAHFSLQVLSFLFPSCLAFSLPPKLPQTFPLAHCLVQSSFWILTRQFPYDVLFGPAVISLVMAEQFAAIARDLLVPPAPRRPPSPSTEAVLLGRVGVNHSSGLQLAPAAHHPSERVAAFLAGPLLFLGQQSDVCSVLRQFRELRSQILSP